MVGGWGSGNGREEHKGTELQGPGNSSMLGCNPGVESMAENERGDVNSIGADIFGGRG